MTIRRRRLVVALAVPLASLTAGIVAYADAPKLLRSEPADGAKDVALDIGVIRLVFERDMRTDSHTIWQAPAGETPPFVKGADPTWPNARTCEVKIERLQPGKEYVLQLNSERRQGFRAAADNEPLPVTLIRFTTVAAAPPGKTEPGGALDQPVKPPQTQPSTQASRPAAGTVLLKWNAQVGQVTRVTQSSQFALKLAVTAEGKTEKHNIEQSTKTQYVEETLEVENGRPTRLNQRVESGQVSYKDPDSGELRREDLPIAGLDVELRVQPDGSMEVLKVNQGEEDLAEDLAAESRWLNLLPDRAVKVGESWELKGPPLEALLAAIGALQGEVTLRLVKIEKDAQLGQDVARLEGQIKVRMQLPIGVEADADGTLTEDFVPELGLPILRQLKATLRVDQTLEAGERVTGNGDVEMREERAPGKSSRPKDTTPPLKDKPPMKDKAPETQPARPGGTEGKIRPGP